MNLYEWEGKKLFAKHGIATPKGVIVRRGEDVLKAYSDLALKEVVVKAQVLSGKRGKNNGIKFCSNAPEVKNAVEELFVRQMSGQYVASVLIEEKLKIAEEHYISITYDTNKKQPGLIYSTQGGMEIEEVEARQITKIFLDVRNRGVLSACCAAAEHNRLSESTGEVALRAIPFAQAMWECFLDEDARLVEINPLVRIADGRFIAADAKVALDDDAFYRHGSTSSPQATEWKDFEPRSMLGRLPTERELAVKKIDEGEAYYRGTAGKYIEMDGDIATLFSGGGASIANMDALLKTGLKPANYTEYSGNPPREKVAALAKIVLSKPGLRGLWIAGGVANFTNIAETFQGIVDALDEVKPTYPIVVRRAGPYEEDGMRLMHACRERNNLRMKLFGKEMSMSETASVLAEMVDGSVSLR